MEVQIGNDITNLEVIRWLLRSQFDRNLVTLYDVQVFPYEYSLFTKERNAFIGWMKDNMNKALCLL